SLERDIPILKVLWLWKAAPTGVLAVRFYGDKKAIGLYRRIKRLEKAGLVQLRPGQRGFHFVWTLTTAGFKLVKPYLPDLRDDGFKSENLGHDLLVNAVHWGDCVRGFNGNVEVCT